MSGLLQRIHHAVLRGFGLRGIAQEDEQPMPVIDRRIAERFSAIGITPLPCLPVEFGKQLLRPGAKRRRAWATRR